MNITIETSSYNQRRYGKPWIALVNFESSTKGDFAWGDWTGDHYNGGAGILSINANPGDIVAQGQKDNRNSRNSAPDFYVVTADGGLDDIGDKGAAYKYFLEQKKATPDMAALETERKQLQARIVEIDALLSGCVPAVAAAAKVLYPNGINNN